MFVVHKPQLTVVACLFFLHYHRSSRVRAGIFDGERKIAESTEDSDHIGATFNRTSASVCSQHCVQLCTYTFIFTFFFSLRVRPMWPVGCSLVSQYKLARIKGVTTVSPVLVVFEIVTYKASTRFIYPGGMEGWVDLGCPATERPGVELASSRSQVRRPNHYSTERTACM